MLQLRPNCECCDKDLPPESAEALICSFECTFCVFVRDNCTEGQVSELRRRARRASAASRREAREVSGLHAARAETARLRRRSLKNPRENCPPRQRF